MATTATTSTLSTPAWGKTEGLTSSSSGNGLPLPRGPNREGSNFFGSFLAFVGWFHGLTPGQGARGMPPSNPSRRWSMGWLIWLGGRPRALVGEGLYFRGPEGTCGNSDLLVSLQCATDNGPHGHRGQVYPCSWQPRTLFRTPLHH